MTTEPALTYTNRKGQSYYLCEVASKRGKKRCVFAKAITGTPVTALPKGYEITESVNGVVSLRKTGASSIPESEVEVVRQALSEHKLGAYCVEAKKDAIIVFQPLGAVADANFMRRLEGMGSTLAAEFNRHVRFDPIMRFVLVDAESREFEAERMCYRSSVDGWLSLHATQKLPALCKRYFPHLGEESFFELI
jgi:hypothetical protein